MEKAKRNIVLRDSSEDAEKRKPKVIREDRKFKSKRNKRKRETTDLHQRVLRAKKVLDRKTKIENKTSRNRRVSQKICSRLLPRPLLGMYRNGAAGKEIRRSDVAGSVNDINNARLEGNMFKLLNAYESKTPRKVGDEKVDDTIALNILFDSVIKDTPPSPQKVEKLSPILVKVDGKKRHAKKKINEDYVSLMNNYENDVTKKKIDAQEYFSPISRYEELCNTVSENFKLDDITEDYGPDPLTATKQKLRNFYAESIHKRSHSDIAKRGTPWDSSEIPATSTMSESYLAKDTEFLPTFNNSERPCYSKQNIDYIDKDKRKQKCSIISDEILNFGERSHMARCSSSGRFLFDASLLNSSKIHEQVKNNAAPRASMKTNNTIGNYNSTNEQNYVSQEVNTDAATFKKTNDANRSDKLFSVYCNDKDIILKKITISATSPCVIAETELCDKIYRKESPKKQKDRFAQTIPVCDDSAKRHFDKYNLKSQGKMKHYKHVPSILRRCNNIVYVGTCNSSLPEKSMQPNRESEDVIFKAAKQNVQFTQGSSMSEVLSEPTFLNSTSILDIGNIQKGHTTKSDSNLNNAKWWIDEPCTSEGPPVKPRNVDIFGGVFLKDRKINNTEKSREMHPQKTMIFTKKDPNIQHSLHLANRLQEVSLDNDSCEIKKKIHHEKLTRNHCNMRNYHQTQDNCCLNRCSHSFDLPNFNFQNAKVPAGYQDAKFQNLHGNAHRISNIQAHQNPVNHQNLIIKRILRHPKQETNQKLCHNAEQRVRLVVVDCETPVEPHCSQNFANIIPNVDSRPSQGHIYSPDEEVPDVGILNGVQNMRLLSMDESESRMDLKLDDCCVGNAVILDSARQPIKYLAFENKTEIKRVPVYSKSSVGSMDDLEFVEARRNRRYPRENVQEVMLVPRCEQEKIVYMKPQSLSRNNAPIEGCSDRRKVFLCQPEARSNVRIKKTMNLCEIPVSKKAGIAGRNTEQERVVYGFANIENVQKLRQAGANWKNL